MLERELLKKRGGWGGRNTHTHTHTPPQNILRLLQSLLLLWKKSHLQSDPHLRYGCDFPVLYKQDPGYVVGGWAGRKERWQSHTWRCQWSTGNPLSKSRFLTPCFCLGSGNPTTSLSFFFFVLQLNCVGVTTFFLIKCRLLQAPADHDNLLCGRTVYLLRLGMLPFITCFPPFLHWKSQWK